MKAFIYHSGCRLNQYESTSLKSGISKQGFHFVENMQEADVVILNTCTVTNRADQKNRQTIRKVHRLNPKAKIIVTGCYATTDEKEINKLAGVSLVVPNQNKASIPQLLLQNDEELSNDYKTIPRIDGQFGYEYRSKEGYARAYLKIQDGCNKSCSYCKIPQARGKARSRNIEDIIKEAKYLIHLGFTEIMLTGVNIGSYEFPQNHSMGNSITKNDFCDLLEKLLDLDGDFYIKISSIEPGDVTKRLASLYRHSKLAKFLHVPLQSGSKQILKWMNRGYSPKYFEQWVNRVRKECPQIHLGTDVIVGFPGETEEYFEETLEFCEKMKFANIHIFPYSKRKNTPILKKLKPKNGDFLKEIPREVIKQRILRVMALKEKMFNDYLKYVEGKTFRGIIEKIYGNEIEILTENYIRSKTYSYNDIRYKRGDMVYLECQGSNRYAKMVLVS